MGTQKIKLDLDGVSVKATVPRDLALYPRTDEGFALLKSQMEDPAIQPLPITITSGERAGEVVASILSLPSWVSGIRYSHTGGVLTIESTSGVGSLAFLRQDGGSFTTTNPDGITINGGQFYGPAGISLNPFVKRWQINNAVPFPICIKLQQPGGTGAQAVINFMPTTGAVNIPLWVLPTTATTSTTTTGPQALAFDIVSYNVTSGILRYRVSGGNGNTVLINLPGVIGGAIVVGTTYTHTFPADGRTGRLVTGSLLQVGNPSVNIRFTTGPDLGPTVSSSTTAPATSSSSSVTRPPATTSTSSVAPLGKSYPRSLIVANSIGIHGGTGQNVGDFIVNAQNPARGMAATTPEKDFVRRLGALLRAVNPAIDHRTLATFDLGGQLDAATGPFLESQLTNEVAQEFYNELSPRLNPVVQFAPAILYMRLGENVDDGRILTIGKAEFKTRYKALIDKLVSGNNACKVVLSTSVWDKPNFDQCMLEIAAERSYPIADFRDMWPNRNTNGYYAFGQYTDAGVSQHPDDEGMARIASDLFFVTPGAATPSSSTVPPTNIRTFNYPTVAEGTTGGWTAVSNESINGEIGPIPFGEVYRAENSFIAIEIRRGMGGALQITNKADGRRLINHNDQGRGSEICIYSGPKDYSVGDRSSQWFDIGYNPILQGNYRDVPSPVIASGVVTGNDGKSYFYTKTHMISWASGAVGTSNPPVLTETFAEKWTTLDGKSVRVHLRVTNNRSDLTFYNGDVGAVFNGADGVKKYFEGVAQEYPNMMVSGGGHEGNVKYYIGPNPGSGDMDPRYLVNTDLRESPGVSFVEGVFKLSEPYFAVEYDRTGKYIFLNTERMAAGGAGLNVPQFPNEIGEDVNPSIVVRASASLIHDPKGTWYHDYNYFVTDNFEEGRAWANAQPKVHGEVPNWTFDAAHGRNDWRVAHGIDQMEPFTSDNWKCVMVPSADGGTPSARRSALKSPAVAHKANLIRTIYFRVKYGGPGTDFKLRFDRNAQSDQSYPPKRQAAQAPDGLVNGGTQAFDFRINNNNQWQTIAIDTTTKPSEWRGIIQQYEIQYATGPVIAQNDMMEVSYFGVNNPDIT